MRAAFWEEPRLSKWSHNLPILSCKKCHLKVCAGGLTTGCSAVNTTVCLDEARKEWKSEGLTMKSVEIWRSHHKKSSNRLPWLSARYLLCFQSKPAKGHGTPGWPWNPNAQWLHQNLQKSCWEVPSKTWKCKCRRNPDVTCNISHPSRCMNPFCSPTLHLLPSWKVDHMAHQVQ